LGLDKIVTKNFRDVYFSIKDVTKMTKKESNNLYTIAQRKMNFYVKEISGGHFFMS
jgi:hypothetical protein